MKLWKSIIPHRREQCSNAEDIYGVVYWFTNKRGVVEWMKPNIRSISQGAMMNIIDYRYLN